MDNKTKKIFKLIVIAVLIIGFYYASEVKPIEEKRVEATVDNFKNADSFGFRGKLSLEDSREGFYDLEIDGFYGREGVFGDYKLSTGIEGSTQEVRGSYIYGDGQLFLSFAEDGLPITLEGFFGERGVDIETARGSWLALPFDYDFYFSVAEGEMATLSEEEEIDEKKMYKYDAPIEINIFRDSVKTILYTGMDDLNLYRAEIEDRVSLTRNIDLGQPFSKISTGSSPTFILEIDFFDFNEEKEVDFPDEFIEL